MAKKKPESKPEAIKQTILSPEQIKSKSLAKYPYAAKIKIDDEDILIREIEKDLTLIETMRDERGLKDIWREDREQYEGIVEYKDFPWEGAANLHIHLTAMSVDILRVKACAQMFVKPMMLAKPLPGQVGKDLYQNMQLKESYIDNKVRDEMDAESALDPAIKDGINLGTGFIKLSYLREIDYDALNLEIYESTPEDLQKFEQDFEDSKDTPEYRKHHKDLLDGKTIEVWVTKDEITYDNPKIEHVELENLLVRPDIADIEKNRVICEEFKLTWYELLNRVTTNYFLKDPVMELREKYPDEYNKKIYDVREVICYHDYEKTDRPQRVVVTYLKEEKKILRAITFPYIHRRIYYIPYYIDKNPNSIYGNGISRRLRDTNQALNTLWNQTIDAGTIKNAPSFKAIKDSSFDPTVKKYGPAVIWWLKNMGDVQTFDTNQAGGSEMINLISRMERYAEWLTGVSAYMTGRESPLDPNAPMGKAYMLLKEANLRINKYIKQLHKSNIELFRQVDGLLYQNSLKDKNLYINVSGEKIETVEISRKVLGLKVNYIPQLSDITINKEQQKEEDMKFAGYLLTRPYIMNNPKAIRTINEILIRNQGGQWEKNIDTLLPPEPSKGQPMPMPGGMPPPTPGMAPGGPMFQPGAGIPAEMIPRE